MTEVIRGDKKELKKDLISSLIDVKTDTKEKFLQSLEKQEEKVQGCLDEMIEILQEHIPRDFLIQAVTQFENLQLLLIVRKLNNNKHFTKNQIAVNFLAILDNLLASTYDKLSQFHFEALRENMQGLSTGKSFSYNEMKKIQIELIQKGYISKIRKIGYTLRLKDQYCKIINHMMSVYPKHFEKLSAMEIKGYDLVHSKSIPKLEITQSAAVVLGSLINEYFKKKDEQTLLWKYLENITNEEEEKIKRKVYRFKANLKKENDDTVLFSYGLE